MALEIGTNCGFVPVAPTADPAGQATSIDSRYFSTLDIPPAGASKITEIGWWCNNATEAANFEVGLYSDTGNSPPAPYLLLQAERTNAKGTTAGWKVRSGLNWSITPGTKYWITVQIDDTATTTQVDRRDTYTGKYAHNSGPGVTTLPDNGAGSATADRAYAVYALYETGVSIVPKLNSYRMRRN